MKEPRILTMKNKPSKFSVAVQQASGKQIQKNIREGWENTEPEQTYKFHNNKKN